jgi:hypothetical protein
LLGSLAVQWIQFSFVPLPPNGREVTITFVYGAGSFHKRLLDEGLDVPMTKRMSKSKCHNSWLATGIVTR